MPHSRSHAWCLALALWIALSACGVVSEDAKKVIDSSVATAIATKEYMDAKDDLSSFQGRAAARAKAGFRDGSDRYAAFMAKPTPSSITTLKEAQDWRNEACIALQMADHAFGETQIHGGNANVSFDEPVMHSYLMLHAMSAKFVDDAFVVAEQLPDGDRQTFHLGEIIKYPADVVADAKKREYKIMPQISCTIAAEADRAEGNMRMFLDGLDPDSIVYKPNISAELKGKGADGPAKITKYEDLATRSRNIATP